MCAFTCVCVYVYMCMHTHVWMCSNSQECMFHQEKSKPLWFAKCILHSLAFNKINEVMSLLTSFAPGDWLLGHLFFVPYPSVPRVKFQPLVGGQWTKFFTKPTPVAALVHSDREKCDHHLLHFVNLWVARIMPCFTCVPGSRKRASHTGHTWQIFVECWMRWLWASFFYSFNYDFLPDK